jgi:hypothetical protein
MDSKDIIVIAVLFIAAFFLWTLPFQQNPLPFGEGDSAWHFSIGDYMHSSNTAIWRLPYYVGIWYYGFNAVLGPFALEYPPANHVNYALVQFFGDRFVSVLMIRAITSFLGVFATYFLVRKLYGFLPAAVASLALVFSLREQMIYLWGQQPTLSSFVIIPVLLYSFYRYVMSLYEGKPRHVYIYTTAALVASQYMLHLQGLLISLPAITLFIALMAIKHKKIPVSKGMMLHIGIAAVLLLAVMVPFAQIYLGAKSNYKPGAEISRLLQWNISPEPVSGSFPASFVEFSSEYLPWSFVLLIIGIIALILRRDSKDLLMLSWLAAMYFAFHLDFFLGNQDWMGRIARMGIAEPQLFYSLMAIGLFSLLSFIKIPSQPKILLKYGVAIGVSILLIFTLGAATKERLKDVYGGISRLTPEQLDAAVWLKDNTPENSIVYDVGTFGVMSQSGYAKTRWLLAASQRHVGIFYGQFLNATHVRGSPSYFIFDYSDLLPLANSQYSSQFLPQLQKAQEIEHQMFANATPLYEKNNIKVYNATNPYFD